MRNAKNGLAAMKFNGAYQYCYSGYTGVGVGVFSIKNDAIWGGDWGGITYEGKITWQGEGNPLVVPLSMTIPPGSSMVQGTAPQEILQRREFQIQIPEKFAEGDPFQIIVPPGPVWIAARRIPETGIEPICRRLQVQRQENGSAEEPFFTL